MDMSFNVGTLTSHSIHGCGSQMGAKFQAKALKQLVGTVTVILARFEVLLEKSINLTGVLFCKTLNPVFSGLCSFRIMNM